MSATRLAAISNSITAMGSIGGMSIGLWGNWLLGDLDISEVKDAPMAEEFPLDILAMLLQLEVRLLNPLDSDSENLTYY